jgi:DNA-directed RNA polymerase specialized sigma24 family protein
MGDEAFAAFAALRPQLVRQAALLLRGSRVRTQPEDLVQTVMAKILTGLRAGTLQAEAVQSPRSFAYRCLHNLFLDELKAHRTKLEGEYVEPDRPAHDGPGHEGSLVWKQVLTRLAPGEGCFLSRVIVEERSVFDAQQLCRWPDKAPYYHLKLLLDRVREMIS